MSERLFTTESAAGVALVTVTRPKALNALNAEVQRQLLQEFAGLSADPEIRAILLTGDGEKSFIAGADISEFVDATPSDAINLAKGTKRLIDAISGCPKPVIAVINGYCFGIGMEVALACDLRVASRKAQLGLPEIKLGILPGGGGTVRLTKLAGSSVAKMMAMTGEPISAERAFELGLVAAVHEPEQLLEAARALASKLASYSPFAMTQLKSSLSTAIDADTESACEAEIKAFALCYSTADQKEGARAFLEKRKPVFTGR